MRIILDTDKKTITVPWNYQQKLDKMNELIVEVTKDEKKKKTFSGYIQEVFNEAMKDTDKNLIVGKAPKRKNG